MGCKHSTSAIKEADVGTNADNKTDSRNTTTTTTPQLEHQQIPLVHDDELLSSDEDVDAQTYIGGGCRNDNVDNNDRNGKPNQDSQPPLHSKNHANNDDFTTDYVILKQVMVGMSALSNIYMVMKRPPNDIEQEDQPQPQQPDDEGQTAMGTVDQEVTAPLGTTSTPSTTIVNNHVNEVFVLQVIDMDSVAPERRKSMRKEMIALKSIIHPNILRVHAVYDATRRDHTIATVTELCTGSHLHSSTPYPEPRAKIIISQILDALLYMHQRGLFHNSLNTENILFHDENQDAMIKITYAGVANLPSLDSSNRFRIPEWNPPGKDIYSVGMIAYKLLSGGKEPPTDMDTQRVVPGTNLFLGRRWKLISISKNAKNFIEKCLHSWDTKPQFTVEDAIQHIWMTQEHVHRSDTSRPTDVMNESAVAQWNIVGSSLTASEPTIFHPPSETLPAVSLTTEQYAREVTSKSLDNADDQHSIQIGGMDDSNIAVFVDNAVVTDTDTENDVLDVAVEKTVLVADHITQEVGYDDASHESNDVVLDVDTDTAVFDEVVESTAIRADSVSKEVGCDDAAHESNDVDTVKDTSQTVTNLDDEAAFAVQEEARDNDIVTENDNMQIETVTGIPPENASEKPCADQSLSNFEDDHNPNTSTDDTSSLPTPVTVEDTSETHTPDEFMDLREAFHDVVAEATAADAGDGRPAEVTMETLKERLRDRYTEVEVNTWFSGHERYEDPKSVNYKVFLRKVIQNRRTIEIQRVDAAFKLIDKGKHGYVTVGNLRAVLGKDNNDNIEQLIKTADTNRDGTISHDNFERVVQNYLSSTT